MIRFVLVLLFVVLFLIVSIPVALVEWIIGRFNPGLKSRSSLAYVNWAFRVILFFAGTKLTIIGKENIPTDTAVLYVGNHRSFFDIVTTYPQVVGLTGYIAKKELNKVPLLRTWMKNLHCLFLDRNNTKEGLKTILEGIDLMKNEGISMCIFPEGTRNKVDGTFLPFHAGSFKLAEKSGCPVIPMTLNNAAAIFEDHLPWIKKAHVILEYGKPIYISELSKEDKRNVPDIVLNIIKETHEKNKALI